MKALKVDENGFKWMKMVKMDEFFFLGPNFAKNRPEVKKFAFWRNFASNKNTGGNATENSKGTLNCVNCYTTGDT
jgi:hypothetical protein